MGHGLHASVKINRLRNLLEMLFNKIMLKTTTNTKNTIEKHGKHDNNISGRYADRRRPPGREYGRSVCEKEVAAEESTVAPAGRRERTGHRGFLKEGNIEKLSAGRRMRARRKEEKKRKGSTHDMPKLSAAKTWPQQCLVARRLQPSKMSEALVTGGLARPSCLSGSREKEVEERGFEICNSEKAG